MPTRFEIFIARRYLRAKRKEAVVSIVTAISSLGAAFVVAYAIATVHERPEPIQAVGIVLSVLGVASLLYLTY